MDAILQRRLIEAMGRDAVTPASAVVTPRDHKRAVAAVRVCADGAVPLRVRSSTGGGPTAPDTGIVLSLERLTGVTVHAEGLTLRAEAGAPLDAVRASAAAAGLSVVGLGSEPGNAGTLIARGAVPRRSLTGVEAVLPTGEVVAFGGAVLKDVVGYDLPAVLLGSMGQLAVILAVTFRLEPQHTRTPVASAPGASAGDRHALLARAFDPQGLLQSQS